MYSGIDMVETWIKSKDLDVAYGNRFVLMRELYYDYIYYCKSNGIHDICSDKRFSKSLQSMGFVMKYTKNGVAFHIGNYGKR